MMDYQKQSNDEETNSPDHQCNHLNGEIQREGILQHNPDGIFQGAYVSCVGSLLFPVELSTYSFCHNNSMVLSQKTLSLKVALESLLLGSDHLRNYSKVAKTNEVLSHND